MSSGGLFFFFCRPTRALKIAKNKNYLNHIKANTFKTVFFFIFKLVFFKLGPLNNLTSCLKNHFYPQHFMPLNLTFDLFEVPENVHVLLKRLFDRLKSNFELSVPENCRREAQTQSEYKVINK